MACSICGEDGHNARSCKEDYAVWVRAQGLSKKQARGLERIVEDYMDEEAPDATGVMASGKRKELPKRIQEKMEEQKYFRLGTKELLQIGDSGARKELKRRGRDPKSGKKVK